MGVTLDLLRTNMVVSLQSLLPFIQLGHFWHWASHKKVAGVCFVPSHRGRLAYLDLTLDALDLLIGAGQGTEFMLALPGGLLS